MTKIAFSEDELTVVDEIKPGRPERPVLPVYNFPIPPREGYHSFLKRKPVWQITGVEKLNFTPDIVPDNLARGAVSQEQDISADSYGGKDMFGVEWKYDIDNHGSAVDPMNHIFTDANEWTSKLVWPDIDSWDWSGARERNQNYLKGGRAVFTTIFSGYFERLISFMDFGNASIALIDDSQKEAVKALFDRLTELYSGIIDKFIEYFDIDGVLVHDDWGAMRGPLFSEDTAEEMIVPAMKRLTSHIHSKGRIAELHSCGLLESRVPSIIKAGWDIWSPQTINNTFSMYENYGDQLILGVAPEEYPGDADDTRLRTEAAAFVDKYCNPEKPVVLNHMANSVLPPVFREELYRLSRIKFSS